MRVKICGITQPEQGQAIALMGATALGFIAVPQSPRYISADQMAAIGQTIGQQVCQSIDRIGVFADADLGTIVDTTTVGQLTGVQLHGQESIEFCQQLRALLPNIELIKAFRVRSSETLTVASYYAPIVDALLLDAYHPTQLGGTGQTLDWADLQNFQPNCAWFLSGGLNPDNIAIALSQLTPDGIDLSSGVERAPGDKDLAKVSALFTQLAKISSPWQTPHSP